MATVKSVFAGMSKLVTKLEKIKDKQIDVMFDCNKQITYLNQVAAEASAEADLAVQGIIAINKILPKGL